MIGGGGGEIGDGVLCEGANRPSEEGDSFLTVYYIFLFLSLFFSKNRYLTIEIHFRYRETKRSPLKVLYCRVATQDFITQNLRTFPSPIVF